MNRTFLFLGAFVLAVAAGGALYLARDTLGAALESTQTDPRTPEQLIDAARAAFLGDGAAQSDARGAQLILKAAAAGSEQAMGYAGTLYMGGIGVEHSVTKAREWLARSSDAEAQALAEALMAFEAVLATMPEEQAELQKAMNESDARESIRSSFIAAIGRRKLAAAASGSDTEESTAEPEGIPGASAGSDGMGADGEATEDHDSADTGSSHGTSGSMPRE